MGCAYKKEQMVILNKLNFNGLFIQISCLPLVGSYPLCPSHISRKNINPLLHQRNLAALLSPPPPLAGAPAGSQPPFFILNRSAIVMGDAFQSGLKLAPDFQEDSRAPLIELNSTDSTELWLIQWPKDQIPDFDGQQLSLDLHHDDGQLGSFESSSGKSYDVVSSAAQEPKAMVFLSSAADSKIVGKITRRVSFVHYMEPSEVPKDDTKKLKQFYERSSATSLTNSAYNFTTPTKTTRPGSLSGRASTHSSGRKSSLSEEKMLPKPSRSGQDSGRGSELSEEKKAKKRKKHVA